MKQGFNRARVDGNVVVISDDLKLDRNMRHSIEVVVDRVAVSAGARNRIAEAVELGLKIGGGALIVAPEVEPRTSSLDSSRRRRTTGD